MFKWHQTIEEVTYKNKALACHSENNGNKCNDYTYKNYVNVDLYTSEGLTDVYCFSALPGLK